MILATKEIRLKLSYTSKVLLTTKVEESRQCPKINIFYFLGQMSYPRFEGKFSPKNVE